MPEQLNIGLKFGRLTTVDFLYRIVGNKNRKIRFLVCKCECGGETTTTITQLRSGNTTSCGCYKIELQTKHGMSTSREHNSWRGMKERCYNKKSKRYKNYGGRGIKVCDRWKNSFENFLEDMGNVPDKFSLDRIDIDKDYCKENCRWTDNITQQNNKKNNVFLTYNGETKTIAQWSRCLNLDPSLIGHRIRSGWSVDKSFIKPVVKQK